MTTLDAFGSTAAASLIALTITELHVELLSGAVAWAAGWWLLREPAASDPPSGHGISGDDS